MADIAKLVVALEAQSAQFQKEMERATKTVERFEKRSSKSLSRIRDSFKLLAGGFIGFSAFRSAASAISNLADEADHLKDLSSQIGISVESLSTLGKAAEQFGVESEGFNQALIRLNRSIAETSAGNKNLEQSFAQLGVSVRSEITGNLKNTEQVLADVADAFSRLPDGPLKTAAALDIFGKSGAQLIPFLNEGADGVRELQEQIKALGGEISGATAAAADDFNDKLANLKTSFGGLGREIADFVLPKLGAFFDLLSSGASKFRDFIDTTPQERIKELTREIEVLQQKLAVTPDFLGGLFTGRLAAAKKELAELRSEGGLFKDLLPGLTNELNAAGVAAQENLARGLKDADAAAKASAASAKDAAREHQHAIESAAQSLQGLEEGLRQQVETFGLSDTAALQYRLTLGDLSDEVALLGSQGQAFADSILVQSAALEEAAASAEKLKNEQEALRKESEEIRALQQELLPLTSGLDSATLEYADSIAKLDEALARAAITDGEYQRGLESAAAKFEEAEKAAEDASKSSVVFAEEAAKGIQDAFADFFFDPFDKGLKGLLDSTIQTLNRIAAEITASVLADFLFGGKATGSGSGTTGLFQSAGNLLSGLFGGFGGGGSGTPTARASGGPVFAGDSYVVGEEGPELFSPTSNGRIIPNDALGNSIVTNIYVSAPGGRVSQESLEQMQTRVGLSVRRATRRNA